MGLLQTLDRKNLSGLEQIEQIPVSRFCRRRLPIIMTELKMAQTPKQATEMVEQGHVLVGNEVCRNPGLHITRDLQDHITWSAASKIKKHILEYRGEKDDYDFLGN